MKAIITPGSLSGSVEAIPSKSQAHRYLICAALSRNPSRVVCPSLSKDIEATVRCLRALGAKSTYDSEKAYVGRQIAICAQPKVTVKTDSKGKPVVSWGKVSARRSS